MNGQADRTTSERRIAERRRELRSRTLYGGKILFNARRSVIDCVVRNFSDAGACLQVNATVGIPAEFDLVIEGQPASLPCKAVWMSETRIGIEFVQEAGAAAAPAVRPAAPPGAEAAAPPAADKRDLVRGDLLALRAALDEIEIGVVLLDADTRAQFINRAFRRMWRLPDPVAERKPPFVALMYHGRDTRAYAVPPERLDAYVAERVALVKAGDPRPIDLRLTSGEVIRVTCTVLPAGGRMMCYSYVTDIVRFNDKLRTLQAALDNVPHGIVLLDRLLNIEFMNKAARELWAVDEAQYRNGMTYVEFAGNAQRNGMYNVPPDKIGAFIADRIAVIRAGDPMPVDIPHRGDRVVRAQCTMLPEGGRMIHYTDVTDLVTRAKAFERLAATDGMTGLYNRREFDELAASEWSRFQRYQRPLSLLLFDIDRFKSINDAYGHEIGDRAVLHVAALCNEGKRASDIIARIGGDEFAMLLPETDAAQAQAVAERLRERIASTPLDSGDQGKVALTISAGLTQATLSMSGIAALSRIADAALYMAKAAGRNRVELAATPAEPPQRNAAE
jgi:diguanylate cyclase (GGDEF)-like protein